MSEPHAAEVTFGSNYRIVLASASPRRAELLRKIGIHDFSIDPGNVPENNLPAENAQRKAEETALRHPHEIVIGADTVIRLKGNMVLGKPEDQTEAAFFLRLLSGTMHYVITGVCIRCLSPDILIRFEETTKVFFRPLTQSMIERYISSVNVLDKAGAYAIQHHRNEIIDRIEGSEDNVIGLPTERLLSELQHLSHFF